MNDRQKLKRLEQEVRELKERVQHLESRPVGVVVAPYWVGWPSTHPILDPLPPAPFAAPAIQPPQPFLGEVCGVAKWGYAVGLDLDNSMVTHVHGNGSRVPSPSKTLNIYY